MCSCDPQSGFSFFFFYGGISLHRVEGQSRERGCVGDGARDGDVEKHPWLFTKHSLFYLRRAVRGLPSPLYLSLIIDKSLFKCLLSCPIHDWRWHLRNTSEERRAIGGVGGGGGGSAHSILVGKRSH